MKLIDVYDKQYLINNKIINLRFPCIDEIKIGTAIFSNCQSLASITIPNSVTEICAYAFSVCLSLFK